MFVIGIILIVVAIAIGRAKMPPEMREAGTAAKAGGSAVIAIIGVFVVIGSMVKVVQAGTVGVVRTLGTLSAKPLTEGVNFVLPWSTLDVASIRTEEYTMSGERNEGAVIGDDAIRTLSKDGLPLPLEVTINFRPVPSMVPWLYRNIGTSDEFVTKLVRPSARAAVRVAVSQFTAQEAYSTKREELATTVGKKLEAYIHDTLSKSEGFKGDAFIIQQVLIRNIELPEKLKASIEAKLTAEQESLRMEYVLLKEKQEADRKRIEARGIADFQAIVSQGLTDKLLSWKGIEATQELAKSENAKVVIVGGGRNGLPVILNTDGAPAK